MSYNTKNYEKQGGAVTVIGGELNIATGGKITPASGTQAAHIANPTDLATSITAINAILVALEGAGITAAS